MKKILITIIIIAPLTLLGQHVKCCQSITEVESYLSGTWRLASNPKFLFKYTFENGTGYISEMYESDQKGEYLVIDDHPFVEVMQYEQGFKLKYIDLYHTSVVELKYLNAKKMILVTDEKEVIYIKVSE
ncbi:MAG: hypothetical protein AAF611_07110 [Bacteroidota bacterium]